MWANNQIGMLGPARKRWQRLSTDDKILLSIAFADAIKHPHRVGDYKVTFSEERATGRPMVIHEFRFGYVRFIFCDYDDVLLLYDFLIDNRLDMAAE